MTDIPLFQQCRDHRASCEECNTALIEAARGYGYGQPKGCIVDLRHAFSEMCAAGVKIYKARYEEMRTEVYDDSV